MTYNRFLPKKSIEDLIRGDSISPVMLNPPPDTKQSTASLMLSDIKKITLADARDTVIIMAFYAMIFSYYIIFAPN